MNARSLRLAVLISLLFHLGLGLFFYIWRLDSSPARSENEADVAFLAPFPQQPIAPLVPQPRKTAAPRAPSLPVAAEPVAETIAVPERLDSLLMAAESTWVSLPQSYATVPEFFPVPIPLIKFTDSAKRKPTLFPLEKLSGSPGKFTDRAAEDQFRRSSGSQQGVDLAGLAAQGLKALEKVLNKTQDPPPPRLRRVPTREEMAALCAIWSRGTPTEREIYQGISTEIRLTAEGLHAVLDGLVAQGLLQQEIISPRHEFTFQSPLGSKGVEMSRMNILNRVYRYHSRIDQAHMMRFLQAAHYYVGSSARSDSAAIRREIRAHISQLLEIPRQP